MNRLLAVALLLAPLVAVAQPARTPPPELARAHADAARRHFEAKEYAKAVAELEAAIRFDPRAPYVYALGQAQRMAGDCTGAIRSYEQFLGTSPPPRQAEAARENIARCEADLKARPATQPATAPAAQLLAPASARRAPWYRDVLGGSLCGGGLVVAVVGTIVWSVGRSAAERANAAPSYDTYLSNADGAVAKQRAGVAVASVGLALIAAGVVRYVLRPSRHAERPFVTAAPARGGGAVLLSGRF